MAVSAWADPRDTERNVTWTRGLYDAMRPFLAESGDVNYYAGDEGSGGLEAAYGSSKLRRLAEIKAKYDPTFPARMRLRPR